MQTINLIPRKSWIEENAIKVIVTISCIAILIFLIQALAVFTLSSTRNDLEQDSTLIDQQIALQSEKRIPKHSIVRIGQLMNEVEQIKLARKNWLPFFANIIGSLPKEAIISNMNISDEQLFIGTFKFTEDIELIRYVKQLQASSLFKNVIIQNVEFVDPSQQESIQNPIITPTPIPPTSEPIQIIEDEDSKLRNELQQLLDNLSKPIDEPYLDNDSPFFDDNSPFDFSELVLHRESEENVEAIVEPVIPENPYYELIIHIQL